MSRNLDLQQSNNEFNSIEFQSKDGTLFFLFLINIQRKENVIFPLIKIANKSKSQYF